MALPIFFHGIPSDMGLPSRFAALPKDGEELGFAEPYGERLERRRRAG